METKLFTPELMNCSGYYMQWDADKEQWDTWTQSSKTPYKIENFYFFPELLAYGDYVGCTVSRANYEALEENEEIKTYLGDHSYHAIGIPLTIPVSEELLETLERLNDYPLIDKDLLSTIENKLQEESFLDVQSDFQRELIEELETLEWSQELIDRIEAIDTRTTYQLSGLMRALEESTNTYWECETATSAWINISRLLEPIGLTGKYITLEIQSGVYKSFKEIELTEQIVTRLIWPEEFWDNNQLPLALGDI